MNKILLFTSDIVPLKGLPTSGGGLRSWQIINGLESRGFEVDFRMPADRFLCREYSGVIKDNYKHILWNPDTQKKIIDSVKPDVLVFMNAEQNSLDRHPGIPVVIDLHGPRLAEYLYCCDEKEDHELGRSIFISRKLSKLAQADFLMCAGFRQRFYFGAFLLQAGLPIDEINIAFVPVSLSPQLPEVNKDLVTRRFICAGGFYPWQNSYGPLSNLRKAVDTAPGVRVDVFGGDHKINLEYSASFDKAARDLVSSGKILFHGYVTRDELLDCYTRGYAAFDLMERNFEREIAFTTRTIEYLWAGLPVVYNNFGELSEYIEKYRAGWCLDPKDDQGTQKALLEIVNNPPMVMEYGRNAQELVRQHFTWDKTIEPLAEFCLNPRIRTRNEHSNYKIFFTKHSTFTLGDKLLFEFKRRRFVDFLGVCFDKGLKMINKKIQGLRGGS